MKALYQPNWLTPEFPYIPYLICHPHWEGPNLGRFSDAEFSFIKCDDGWFMNQDLQDSWEMAESYLLGILPVSLKGKFIPLDFKLMRLPS